MELIDEKTVGRNSGNGAPLNKGSFRWNNGNLKNSFPSPIWKVRKNYEVQENVKQTEIESGYSKKPVLC
jgi:hypothetical protein